VKALSQFVISVFELVEAEGRDLRTSVRSEARDALAAIVSLALAIAVLILAVPLFAGGTWLMASGLLLWLETQVSRPTATFLAGLCVFAAGVGCLALFRSFANRCRQ
jgi:hypothetical protein